MFSFILENLIQHQSHYLIAIWMFFPRSKICKIQKKVALVIPGYDLNPLWPRDVKIHKLAAKLHLYWFGNIDFSLLL